MNETDLLAYQKYAGDIVALNENPKLMGQLLGATGWSEGRLTYVAVKIGLGMTRLEDPNNPVLANVPDFAWPTDEESVLIEFGRDAIAKAIRTAETTISPEPELGPEAPEAASSDAAD